MLNRRLSLYTVIFLFIIMINPANAEVTSLTLEKEFYTDIENIVFIGTENSGSTQTQNCKCDIV